METVRISRHRWWRGKMVKGESALRMFNGKQCCLGFVCRHYGATVKDICSAGMPCYLDEDVQDNLPRWLVAPAGKGQAPVWKAASINDDASLTEREREAKIKALFKRHGIRAVFVP